MTAQTCDCCGDDLADDHDESTYGRTCWRCLSGVGGLQFYDVSEFFDNGGEEMSEVRNVKQFEVTTDGSGVCRIPERVAVGDKVECMITLGLHPDKGAPEFIVGSYPMEIFETIPAVPGRTGFVADRNFNYETSDVNIKGSRILVEFDMPKNVIELMINFMVDLIGGDVIRHTADARNGVFKWSRDADRQKVQLKVVAKLTSETPQPLSD